MGVRWIEYVVAWRNRAFVPLDISTAAGVSFLGLLNESELVALLESSKQIRPMPIFLFPVQHV